MSKESPKKIRSILATDCGSTTTKAILIEKQGDTYRQTFRGEAPTTVEAPFEDVTRGVLNAIQEVEELSGRTLLDGERIITLGSSAAGHAALRAGLAIGADRVISLAGLVTPDQAGQGEAQHNRNALDELFGPDLGALDLRPGLEARPDTRLSLVFGDAYGPDVARSAAVAGLGNVDLHPMAGVSTHHCAIAAISDGTLIGLLRQGLGQDG